MRVEITSGMLSIFIIDAILLCLGIYGCFTGKKAEPEVVAEARPSKLPKQDESAIYDDTNKHKKTPTPKVDADEESAHSGATSSATLFNPSDTFNLSHSQAIKRNSKLVSLFFHETETPACLKALTLDVRLFSMMVLLALYIAQSWNQFNPAAGLLYCFLFMRIYSIFNSIFVLRKKTNLVI